MLRPLAHNFPTKLSWLLGAVILGLILRAIPLLEKQYFTGDELRSYLAATAHQGEYRQILRAAEPPIGEWAPAQAWTRLLHPEPGLDLWAVAQDLAWYDIHPPLYFWLLHLWSKAVGVTFWAGAFLNLLLELLILALLVAWGQRWLGAAAEGWWLGAIWWLSPVAIRVSPLTRHYVLLTLISLLYVYALDKLLDQGGSRAAKGRAAGLLLFLIWLGLLTHYLFVLVVGTSAVVLIIRLGRQYRHRLLYLLAPLSIAVVLFVWLYPDFLVAFTFLQESRPDFWSGVSERMRRSVVVNLALFLPLFLGLLGVLVVQTLAFFKLWREHPQMRVWFVNPHLRMLAPRSWVFQNTPFHSLAAFAWLPMLGVDLLYLLLISPHHAMGPHYVNFCTPFVAWLTLRLLKTAWSLPHHVQEPTPQPLPSPSPFPYRTSAPRLLTLLLLVLLNLALLHPALRNFGFAPRLHLADLATDGVIVFDHPASIHWLNFALHLPADQPVYVAQQADLLAQPDRWLPRLHREGGLYLTWTLFNPQKASATLVDQERIRQLIQASTQVDLRATVTPLDLGELRIYSVTPP